MDSVIIGVSAGGLGDHLIYSNLPKLYKRFGAKKVYVSRKTASGEPLGRNKETLDLVWERNPFFDGFTDEEPNIVKLHDIGYNFAKISKESRSPSETAAILYGFHLLRPNWRDFISHKPDVYYIPQFRADFQGKVCFDPSSISQSFSSETLANFAETMAKRFDFNISDLIILTSAHSGHHGKDVLPDNLRYKVESIYEYIDIVFSVSRFLVAESGGASIAAAFRDFGTDVLFTTRGFNERNFIWPSNNYSVTGAMHTVQLELPAF